MGEESGEEQRGEVPGQGTTLAGWAMEGWASGALLLPVNYHCLSTRSVSSLLFVLFLFLSHSSASSRLSLCSLVPLFASPTARPRLAPIRTASPRPAPSSSLPKNPLRHIYAPQPRRLPLQQRHLSVLRTPHRRYPRAPVRKSCSSRIHRHPHKHPQPCLKAPSRPPRPSWPRPTWSTPSVSAQRV